ncbi:uncharacterized protein BJ171DRAFT_569450 [Polychytrium aggregatum]|uniref:uncharacterized protein n=1 Tax=Polychytrium aggregatum TaxID=110093 RepID=UPI0022FDEBED|nr:uncharacterized protein BJ171DRAFT_569450 [Polychytrium aggregatum]KAI9202663.1 hypothetical protein BJ171DRAFT_569450 [Polychytrium aggregatum]
MSGKRRSETAQHAHRKKLKKVFNKASERARSRPRHLTPSETAGIKLGAMSSDSLRAAPIDDTTGRSPAEKHNRPFQVEPGMVGVFVSCTLGREKYCIKELYNLFDEYAERLYGKDIGLLDKPGASQGNDLEDDPAEDDDDDEDESFEAAFAKEVQGLKTSRSQKRFVNVNISIDCCVFMKFAPPIVPTEFVHTILSDLYDTKLKKCRYTHRLIPISATTAATMPSVVIMAKNVLKPHFHDAAEPKKFAIVFKARNNDKIDRDELIATLAQIVNETEAKHTVDLKQPDLVIIVEVFKSVCGMSVVEDYYKFRRFNLHEIFEGDVHDGPRDRQRKSKDDKGDKTITKANASVDGAEDRPVQDSAESKEAL